MSAGAERREETRAGGSRPWALVAALAVWLWSTLAHTWGTELASGYFGWARTPGTLHAAGGDAGIAVAQRILVAAFLLPLAAAAVLVARRVRTMDRGAARERLLAWALWAAFLHVCWKVSIIYATEFVHFLQYGVIGAMLCAALGRGARPQTAFLLATGLGTLDEAWQHWGIDRWIEGDLRFGYDWSDVILNAAGACGGAMFVAALSRGAGDPGAEAASSRLLHRTVAALGVVLLPVLLLDRVTLSKVFGTYRYHPFWNEVENGKSVHWLTPGEGIPLFVASVLFLGLLLTRAATVARRGATLATLLLLTLCVSPPSRREGRPLHEDVPTARARCVAAGAVVIDGLLDEAAWTGAERLGPFRHSRSGATWLPLEDGSRLDLAPTHARLLWDDDALYVAFEAEDADVWGRPTVRDDPRLPGDEVVEVFVDPDGDEVTYHEFEVSPLNVVYDLFNLIPETPADLNPSAPFVGLADWDARGFRSAVAVEGTLDRVEDWDPSGPPDEDRRWTVEIAIPWTAFRTTTMPSPLTVVSLPPKPGDRWRVGLYRVERPRRSPLDGAPLSRSDASRFEQLQAWSPSQTGSFHEPARFGVVEFVGER